VSPLWSIVLAAGQGRRLASLTGGVPKQFWSPDGQRTLLEHTLDRLTPLVPLSRTATVIHRSQRTLAEARLKTSSRESLGLLLDQPLDRGTAAGVGLGLSAVVAADPDAIVVLTPSDHGVEDVAEFRRGLRRAADEIEARRETMVLFGVEASRADVDYGWITARRQPSAPHGWFRPVTGFVEKPSFVLAERLMAAGAVWNTMVMVSRATALLHLFERHLPAMFEVFARLRTLEDREQAAFLTSSYARLASADFSRDLVTPASGLALYTFPRWLGWSDLGTPQRLQAWLARAVQAQVA
jgi:mannose-1-phosphate guanylyltransferase